EKSHLDLHEANNNMEGRVIQRTQELVRANIELQEMIEEHRQTLQNLQRTSRDKRLILDSAGEGIYGVDSSGGVIFANAFTVNRLGWDEEELIGKDIHALTHHTRANGESYPYEECPIHSSLSQQSSYSIMDELFWCKDGSSFPVEYTVTPIIEDGEQKGAVVVFRDVSQRRQTEEALRRTQKMDALGKLTGGIAHDFNNMLGVILGYSELLQHKVKGDPKLEKYATQIRRAGERAKALTAKLLSFSRKESASAELTNINELLFDSSHMLEKTLTARIELILELSEELWPVWIDKASLEDAILNMVINSMHAIPESGSLTLRTQNMQLNHSDMHHMDLEAGDYVLLTLTDTGVGMDAETLHRIFDPFFTTKGEGGTGLGMSQVYGFVQQSNGGINIESEVGQGTRIEIYLPRYHQTEDTDGAENLVSLNEISSGSERILVVDDESALRELTEEMLTEHGYRVLSADSGKRALEILKSEPVDLLLSDVIMPEMDGYQLVEQVEQLYPHIKIQMASGFGAKRHVGKYEQLHQQRLQKPFTSEVLLQRIRELLDERRVILEEEILKPVEWSDKVSTGIEPVDQDHQILVQIMNRCINAVAEQAQDDELATIIEELLDYTSYHFRREEVIMAACDFPGLARHQQGHRTMLDGLIQQINEFNAGRLSAVSLLLFLRSWFSSHVINREQDGEIATHCQNRQEIIEQALAEAGLDRPSVCR
ncbi:MAG: bacteriohemerythrin, partial [Gammaproteobacteria bacterium]|nr:bacteriohemerythrin [Gammaproteobacteria bacterium]